MHRASKPVAEDRLEADRDFHWRGGDVSRIEGLSDGVFALAIALLAIQQAVPSRYERLLELLRELPAFALCFAFLAWCWFQHFRFFRRYGAQDAWTFVLNAALLAAVLAFVYPLRFFSSMLVTGPLFYGGVGRGPDGSMGGSPALMTFYTAAFVAIFGLFFLLNRHAWSHRARYELDEVETELARAEMRMHLISVGIGALALGLSLAGRTALAGYTFFLLGPAHGLHGSATYRRVGRLKQTVAE
ncbi:MAG: DUF1211 domain-containing protein [Planctomycetes bacterium]|nr:DUF1211 domain-containing protein [Planctomycetota bacterium]MCB9869799.1 DUF1211 domain-containing protein [Planctomycetota bacterium]